MHVLSACSLFLQKEFPLQLRPFSSPPYGRPSPCQGYLETVTAAAVAREKAKLLQRFQEQKSAASSAAAAADEHTGEVHLDQLRDRCATPRKRRLPFPPPPSFQAVTLACLPLGKRGNLGNSREDSSKPMVVRVREIGGDWRLEERGLEL